MKKYHLFLALLLVAGIPSLLGLQGLVSAGDPLPVVTTLSAISVANSSATLRGTIIPGGSTGSGWFEYGTTSALGSETLSVVLGSGTQAIEFSHSLTGLNQLTTYYYRAVGENKDGETFGNVMTFTTGTPTPTPTPGVEPKISTDPASNIAATSVTLEGRVTPMSSETSVWFEYGLTDTLGAKTGEQTIASSTAEVSFTHSIMQLLSNTLYYYRAVAKNAVGTSLGDIISFKALTVSSSPSPTVSLSSTVSPTSSPTPTPSTTPAPTPVMVILPVVITDPVSAITPTTTMLHGTVNPNGVAANAWFEYGATPSLGSTAGFRSLPTSFSTTSFGETVVGLLPNTKYYYRIAAHNIYGDILGGIVSFTTGKSMSIAPSSSPKPSPSTSLVILPTPSTAPAQPTGLSPVSGTFSAETRSISLSWHSVAGEAVYAVRVEDKTDSVIRDSSNNCPGDPHYVCLDDVRTTSTTVQVTPGHTYNWWVHAVSTKGPASTRWSKTASGSFSVLKETSVTPSPSEAVGTLSPLVEETPVLSPADLDADLATPDQSKSRLSLLGFVAVAALGGFALAWLIFARDRSKES